MTQIHRLATDITKAAASATTTEKPVGICPCCTGIHRLTKGGGLARHGWQARNVRHGQSSGFHIGGHGGHAPIGTEAGNALAQGFAASHRKTADHLEALPGFTRDDAEAQILHEIHVDRQRSVEYRHGLKAARELTKWTKEDLKTTPHRGHCDDHYLDRKVKALTEERALAIVDHRAHADLLDALVRCSTTVVALNS
jgi:hypothetical protein